MPDEHVALLRHAETLLAAGKREPAIAAFRRFLAARPNHGDAWFNLGYLLRQQGRHEEALDAYAAALASGVRNPEEARLNRAAILSTHLHRDADARAELLAALELVPGHPPALLNLGNLHEELGEREAAIACYERMLASPGGIRGGLRYEALARLVQLRPPTSRADSVLAAIERDRDAPGMPEDVRANLLFALGRAYDALGAYDDAFATFSAANLHAHRRFPPYDAATTRQRLDRLLAMSATSPAQDRPMKHEGPQPLFICGMFRSGSTLIERVIAGHPQVAAAGETELMPRLAAAAFPSPPRAPASPAGRSAADLASTYLEQLHDLLPERGIGYRYVTDKRPDNFLLIGLIKRLFPNAKIVHTCRSPLDNGLSIYMHHLNPRRFDYAGSLAAIGHYFGEYRRMMGHWKSLYPGDIHDFDYDAFVARPLETLEPLLAFLDLPWDDALLDFHGRKGAVRTASYWQVRKPLYGDASGRWRHYHRHLVPLFESLEAAGVSIRDSDRQA